MEKRAPHYILSDVQAAVSRRGIRAFTVTARQNAIAMGLTASEAVNAILSMERDHFYKSMTTRLDHTMWQDIYHVPTHAGTAYVKVTLCDGSVVIQFKKR